MLKISINVVQAETSSGLTKGDLKNHTHKTNLTSFKGHSGFSLIELMISLSILSITLSSAIPYLGRAVGKSKVQATSFDLQTTIKLARQYAITSSFKVHLCPLASKGDHRCSDDRDYNANWSQGWLVYADLNDNNELDDSDDVIRINVLDSETNIVFNQRGRLRFFNDGSARSAGFYVCNSASDETRHIRLLYTGRSRTSEITTEKHHSICLSANA